MGMSSLCLGYNITSQHNWINQVGTLIKSGIYLGHSPYHIGSVALVLNPETGHVSPQFHVVFDTSSIQLNLLGKEQ